MKRRILDGEYRLHEPDPGLTREAAAALLTYLAQDPHALARLAEDCPALKHFNSVYGDDVHDDAHDAVYEACARAVIAIPDEAAS